MILVSACLAGFRCRYDGAVRIHEETAALVREGQAVPVCPEMLGGLPCPRVPCERTAAGTVTAKDGTDQTKEPPQPEILDLIRREASIFVLLIRMTG